jgi:hypothetical protein
MEWQIDAHDTLAYIAGYQKQNSSFTFGVLGTGNLEIYDSDCIDHVKSYSHELNLTSNYGRLANRT